jgi:DNA-binding MarR family transcriptional regulator
MRNSQHKLESVAKVQCAIIRFVRTRDQAVRADGLEPLHYQFLMLVEPFHNTSHQPNISDMANQLGMQHHSAVELVSRLVDRGLLRRKRAKHDRRHVHLHVTPVGKKLLMNRLLKEYPDIQQLAQGLLPELKALVSGNGKRTAIRAQGSGTHI